MTSVTQTHIDIQWAPHELQLHIWTRSFEEYIQLYGYDSIPSLTVKGNHIIDSLSWLQDRDPRYIDTWREELQIYKEVMSQVDLP